MQCLLYVLVGHEKLKAGAEVQCVSGATCGGEVTLYENCCFSFRLNVWFILSEQKK